jgi:hypothetical protein
MERSECVRKPRICLANLQKLMGGLNLAAARLLGAVIG